jgi:hypothetical protein
MHYKSPENSLHFIEPEFAHLLPEGFIQITDAEAEALKPVTAPPTYRELRAAEYPPIAEILDGLVKCDEAQIQAYRDTCIAIKLKYPKK